jgi:acetylornithine deacetylase/succinyl-diaminopimelate desuccinylase-like protein
VDDLPVNLILVIEGEEEVGSPTVCKYFAGNKHRLRADAAFDPFWAEYGTDVDRPTLTLGTKGVLAVDLIIRGGEWGGPVTRTVHSSVAGWLASPVWRLVKALTTIVNEDDEIIVDGFADEVIITPDDEELLSRIATNFDGKKILGIEGAKRFKYELPPLELLRRYFFSPTVGVSLTAHADVDVIPTEARARLVFRLVPRMTPHRALEMLRRHFEKSCFQEVELQLLYGYPGTRVSIEEPVVESLIRAYAYHGQVPQVLPISASASPYFLFTDVLNIPYVWGGLGRAGRSHAPDEFATVEGLRIFEKSITTFLYMFGSA